MSEQIELRQSSDQEKLIAKLDSLAEAILRLASSNEMLVAAMAEDQEQDYGEPRYLDGKAK
jgi:hypothetical protein